MRALLILLAVLVLLAPAVAVAKGKKKESPREKFLKGIGKAFEKSESSTISSYFPDEGKIELKLHGVKEGKYRKEQAKSLVSSFFKKIEPKKYELKDAKSGKFKMKYKVKADGTEVEGKTWVYLEKKKEKERETWLIVGIVES